MEERSVLPECAKPWEHRTVRAPLRDDRGRVRACACGGESVSEVRMRRRWNKRFFPKCVSVGAALWVLLAVGSLCPGGAAAPASRERREMSRRAAVWRNPCGTELDANRNIGAKRQVDHKAPAKVFKAAKNTLDQAQDYQNLFAQEKKGTDYVSGVQGTRDITSPIQRSWFELRKIEGSWDFAKGNRDYYERILGDLPAMYKYLELVVGSLESIPHYSSLTSAYSLDLKTYLDKTRQKMRGLLCEFDAFLFNRGIKKLESIQPEEVPIRSETDTEGNHQDFLVFRDTLEFLQVMVDFFHQFYIEQDSSS